MNYFESRLDVMDGKGIIVCMSRSICIDLYDQIIKLRPNLNNEDDREFISVAAGDGYISVLFFQLTLFSAEKWCEWLANQFDLILGPKLRYTIVNNAKTNYKGKLCFSAKFFVDVAF